MSEILDSSIKDQTVNCAAVEQSIRFPGSFIDEPINNTDEVSKTDITPATKNLDDSVGDGTTTVDDDSSLYQDKLSLLNEIQATLVTGVKELFVYIVDDCWINNQ